MTAAKKRKIDFIVTAALDFLKNEQKSELCLRQMEKTLGNAGRKLSYAYMKLLITRPCS